MVNSPLPNKSLYQATASTQPLTSLESLLALVSAENASCYKLRGTPDSARLGIDSSYALCLPDVGPDLPFDKLQLIQESHRLACVTDLQQSFAERKNSAALCSL